MFLLFTTSGGFGKFPSFCEMCSQFAMLAKKMPLANCPFVLFVGTKKLVKRKEFEQFISQRLVI